MADLSALGTLNPVEQLDLSNYKDNKISTFQLPRKGRYSLQAPDSFPSTAFTRTNAGALSVQIDPKIVGPTNPGFEVRFVKVSAKPFKRDGITVSQLGDYLRACGSTAILRDEQEQADAAEATANQVYTADLDWRAYHKIGPVIVEGMENFPILADGSNQSWIAHPTEKDEKGEPVKVRANLFVKRFLAAS